MAISSPIRRALTPAIAAAVVFTAAPAQTQTLLFQEDFDGVPLGPPVDEDFLVGDFPFAFSHQPPPGWFRQASLVPGVGDPFNGVFEWEGWSFANRDFWIAAESGDPFGGFAGGREQFTLGTGTIAVADPGQWNDLGDPLSLPGQYRTLLQTPAIDLGAVAPSDERLTLQFDSSFGAACCEIDQSTNPPGDNLTAVVFARVDDGPRFEVLRWESAPFFDASGQPTLEEIDPTGLPNTPNPFFKPNSTLVNQRVDTLYPNDFNERVIIDLTDLLPIAATSSASGGVSGAAAGGTLTLEFGVEGGEGEGFWGIDGIEVTSTSVLLGDMDTDGALDADDIPAFALGMLDTEAYRFDFGGTFPVERGSVDSTFDFDDAAWFVGLMEGAGVASAAAILSEALSPVPEPSTAALVVIAAGLAARARPAKP